MTEDESISRTSDPVENYPRFGYSSWEQVSGYFDGDGSVSLEVVRYILRFRLRFVDTWRAQVESIRVFLEKNGIKVKSVNRDRKRVTLSPYRIEIGAAERVLKTAKAMLPHCVKKAYDLQIVVDYLEGRITGDEAVAKFNEEVRAGRRSGYVRESRVPYTYPEGIGLWRRGNASRARAAHLVRVPREIEALILYERKTSGTSFRRLSKKFGFSESVIRRVLGLR